MARTEGQASWDLGRRGLAGDTLCACGGRGGGRGRGRWNWERDTVSWLLVPALLTAHVPLCKDFVSSVGVHPRFARSLLPLSPHIPSQPHRVGPKPHLLIMGFLEK